MEEKFKIDIYERAKSIDCYPSEEINSSLPIDIREKIATAKFYHDILLAQLIFQYFSYSIDDKNIIHRKIKYEIGDNIINRDDYIWLVLYEILNKNYYPLTFNKNTDFTLYPWLSCYNDSGEYIQFTKIIGSEENQYVFEGIRLSDNLSVIIKWTNERKDTLREIENLERAKLLGVPLFWYDISYSFWHREVLVMEKLEPLTIEDNAYEIGKQILKILQKIHLFAVHNDIKPENIMKKGNKYYLIDFGGIATKLKFYGFEREVWSPLWCSQVKEYGQVTTAKYDLIELLYTLQYLDQWKTNMISETEIKNIIYEPWNEIIELIRNINEKIIDHKIYDIIYTKLHHYHK